MSPQLRLPLRLRLLVWALVVAILGLVFMAYLQPGLMVKLSEQLWACF